jgi:hypothetical protein
VVSKVSFETSLHVYSGVLRDLIDPKLGEGSAR